MAVVLNSEENTYFSASPLRRSHSQPKFVSPLAYHGPSRSKSGAGAGGSGSGSGSSSSNSPHSSNSSSNSFHRIVSPSSPSAASSAPSSPRALHADSAAPSYASTPASSLSLDARCDGEDDEDQILFPSYDDVGYYGQVEDLEPPASPRTGDSYTVSPTSNSTSTNVSRPVSPDPVGHAEDDTAVRTLPSRHVDYLSHNWKEEDIWSSWKLIVSKRKAYNNSARLENASWRTWTKAKNKLKTVSPETLNWLKDCDVTWLYGPLQSGSDSTRRVPSAASPVTSGRISQNHSFLHHKKPILKKRSMSEIMLQRSLSSSSLLKQAAAAIHAQQSEEGGRARPAMGRRTSEYASPFSCRRLSRENTTASALSSISSSGLGTPGTGERKHIHFNEQVEQCIALEMKGDDEPEPYAVLDDDSDSDDGAIMMMGRRAAKRPLPPLHGHLPPPRPSFPAESKTIAMLPSTTLKYRSDTPEPPETAMKHSHGRGTGTLLSPSPSQETLRPAPPATRLLLGDAEDEDEDDLDWQPPSAFAQRKDSVSVTQDRFPARHGSGSASSGPGEPSGMRRTPSGMFMPYEDDEDDAVSEGLFGKVVDTVNTAKDIAHVIWNVGWRR